MDYDALGEEVQQHAREVVRVVVRVAQLVGDGVQEVVAALGVEVGGQLQQQHVLVNRGSTTDGAPSSL